MTVEEVPRGLRVLTDGVAVVLDGHHHALGALHHEEDHPVDGHRGLGDVGREDELTLRLPPHRAVLLGRG